MINKIFTKKFIYILLWLILLLLLSFNNSNAWYTRVIWPYPGYSPFDQNIDITVLAKWTLNSNYIWVTRKILALSAKIDDNGDDWKLMYFWWYNWLPYIYSNLWYNKNSVSNFKNNFYQGFPKYYYICPSSLLWTEESFTFTNCSLVEITNWTVEVLQNFFDNVTNWDYYYFDMSEYNNYWNPYQKMDLCFSSSWLNRTICFRGGCTPRETNTACIELQDSLWIAWFSNFYDINEYYLQDWPWVNNNFNWSWENQFSTGASVTIESDIADSVNYYESRFWFDEEMCYVWTDRLNVSFWNPIDFEFWSWKTIYELYYYLYWSFWQNNVNELWKFLNTWIINYTQRYETVSSDRMYLASYDWPWSNVIMYYTWLDDVNWNPFIWKPAVIYTYMNVLWDYYLQFNGESTPWEEIAFYCNMKLNYDNYVNWNLNFQDLKDKLTPWIEWRINDYMNWTIRWQNWYSVPDWSWNIWDWVINSWFNIPNDLNPTNLFKDFYVKINDLVRNFNPVNANWLLPRRILYPMLFLILFRILRH